MNSPTSQPERDQAIADLVFVHVFGGTVTPCVRSESNDTDYVLDGETRHSPRTEPLTWDGAGQVIETMREMGFTPFILKAWPEYVYAAFGDDHGLQAATFPLAVSLAALRALGVEVEPR